MKFRSLLIAALLVSFSSIAQDSLMFRKISDEVMLHGTCYNNLRVLCKTIGHRISGSPAAAKAVAWGEEAMRETGADKVWLQPVDVPYWYRGYEDLQIRTGNGKYHEVKMTSLGNSVGTDNKVLEAPVIMVNNFDELNALPAADVKGKIVFFNYHFRQDIINTFKGYGDAVRYRVWGPDAASTKGAVGVIIRSISTGMDNMPHTGSTHYSDTVKRLPAAAIGNFGADTLAAECRKGVVYARLEMHCHMMPKMVRSYNVIGEIKGSEYPDKVIVVGGHLDSWDIGEGAEDDGAGCVQSMEVLRTLKALGIRPKYTVRAVLFMNEENGMKGGIAYEDTAAARNEKHIFAIETDAGGYSPRGIGLDMKEKEKEQIQFFKHLFLPYGVYDFDHGGDGTDISSLKKLGVPLAGLLPDSQRYFDMHHSDNDVFSGVSHRELKLGAVVLTQLIYLIGNYGLR